MESHAVPHRLDPLAAQDTEDDHERVEEVEKVPPQQLHLVTLAEQLHAHDGENEYDDEEDEAEIAEGAHRSSDDPDEQVQGRPGFRQLEYSQLFIEMKKNNSINAAWFAISAIFR